MAQAKEKAVNKERLMLEAQLPMEELIAGVRADVEAFAAELGLVIMQQVMAAEIQQKTGSWGQQKAWRYGQQPGYVIFAGRKVSLLRPRLRSPQQQELPLSSYKAFQSRGKLQEAVARQLTRQLRHQALQCEPALEGGDGPGTGRPSCLMNGRRTTSNFNCRRDNSFSRGGMPRR